MSFIDLGFVCSRCEDKTPHRHLPEGAREALLYKFVNPERGEKIPQQDTRHADTLTQKEIAAVSGCMCPVCQKDKGFAGKPQHDLRGMFCPGCGRHSQYIIVKGHDVGCKEQYRELHVAALAKKPARGKQDFTGTIDGAGYKGSMDDSSKPQLTQVPPPFIAGVAQVLMHGAKKYARGNWMRFALRGDRSTLPGTPSHIRSPSRISGLSSEVNGGYPIRSAARY